jgi:hypothetical protein
MQVNWSASCKTPSRLRGFVWDLRFPAPFPESGICSQSRIENATILRVWPVENVSPKRQSVRIWNSINSNGEAGFCPQIQQKQALRLSSSD